MSQLSGVDCTYYTSTYGKSFLECSPLLVLWLVLAQPEHSRCLVYQMFCKKYVCLSGEIVSDFIGCVIEQREESDANCINA